MTLLHDTVLSDLDFDPAMPCTWGAAAQRCDRDAEWVVTCRGCGGDVYRCNIHLAVEKYRARTEPLLGCPHCRRAYRTHGDLNTVAVVRHL